jgi:hypothetical protein
VLLNKFDEMFHIQRRIFVSLIWIGLILLVKWHQYFTRNSSQQFVLRNQNSVPSASSAVEMLSTNDCFLNSDVQSIVDDNKRSSATITGHELYRVMETYSRDKISEMTSPFKRILFWNNVYKYKFYSILG